MAPWQTYLCLYTAFYNKCGCGGGGGGGGCDIRFYFKSLLFDAYQDAAEEPRAVQKRGRFHFQGSVLRVHPSLQGRRAAPRHYISCQTAFGSAHHPLCSHSWNSQNLFFRPLQTSPEIPSFIIEVFKIRLRGEKVVIILWFRITFCIIFPSFRHAVSWLEDELFGVQTVFMIFFMQYFACLGDFMQNPWKVCF